MSFWCLQIFPKNERKQVDLSIIELIFFPRKRIHTKGQLISKRLFGVFKFFQTRNENKSTWGIIVVKSNSFVRFLGELRIKFIYSEKATKFCKNFTLLLTVCTVVKSKVKISQNFAAFSKYMNFNAKKIYLTIIIY